MIRLLNWLAAFLLLASSAWAQIPATLGWYQVPNTSLAPVFTPNNFGGSTYGFFDNRQYLVDSWSSGAFDTKRNRYINLGGGHIGYAGNEFYGFNVDDLTVARLNDPSVPIGIATNAPCGPNNSNTISPGTFACSAAIGPGTNSTPNNATAPAPNSVHTYDGEVYMPNVDRHFIYSGDLWCAGGCISPATWTFSFASMTWQRMNPANDISSSSSVAFPNGFEGATAAYDSNSQKVYVHTIMDKWAYTYDAANGGSYQHLGATQCCINIRLTSIVDPKRKKWVSIGGGEQWVVDISSGSSYSRTALGSSGGATFINQQWPGLAYDPVQDRIVAWAGGNDIGILNMDTLTWTTVTYAGGPAMGAAGTGAFKRFQYSPKNNIFMIRTGTNLNMFTVRLTPESQSLFNFPDRCYGPGVRFCNDFDISSDAPFGDGTNNPVTGTGVYPDNSSTVYPDIVTAQKASGSGSLRIRVPVANAGANPGGFYRGIWSTPFSQNSTYYLQWRQYIPTNFYNIGWSWKQIISSSTGGATCDDVELTNNSSPVFSGSQRIPGGYTRCGSNSPSIGAAFWEFVPDYVTCQAHPIGSAQCPAMYYQQADFRNANCTYGSNITGCYKFGQNKWLTFYWKYTIGTWGSANSRIEGWVAEPNTAAQKYVDIQNFTLTNDVPATKTGYNRLDLTNYMTGRNTPVASETETYFDEVIVSSQPIDFPSGQSISSSSVPLPPGNLRPVP